MTDLSLELQAAIIAKLKADPGVQAVVGNNPPRVYDDVPSGPTFPYISLGDNQVTPDDSDCIDAQEIFWQIDGWVRDPRYPMEKKLSKAVVDALDDANFSIPGVTVTFCYLNTINYLHDPDGITRHVAISFRFAIQAA